MSTWSNISLLLTLTLCLFCPCSAQLGHGEDCELTSDCDTGIGLECHEQKCTCIPESVYIEANSSCRILAGGICDRDGAGLDCVPNARCEYYGNDYSCRCTSYSIEGPDRFCHPTEGGNCDISSDCHPNDQLICTHGRCQCHNPLNQRWDYDLKVCRVMVGFPCESAPNAVIKCDTNMTCAPDNLSTTGFSCNCGAGFLPALDRERCYKGHLTSCEIQEHEDECDDYRRGLYCRQGQCQCGDAPAQIWDEGQKTCASVEGTMCSLTAPAVDQRPLTCVTGLTCVQNVEGYPLFYGICREDAEAKTSSTTPSNGNQLYSGTVMMLSVSGFWMGLNV